MCRSNRAAAASAPLNVHSSTSAQGSQGFQRIPLALLLTRPEESSPQVVMRDTESGSTSAHTCTEESTAQPQSSSSRYALAPEPRQERRVCGSRLKSQQLQEPRTLTGPLTFESRTKRCSCAYIMGIHISDCYGFNVQGPKRKRCRCVLTRILSKCPIPTTAKGVKTGAERAFPPPQQPRKLQMTIRTHQPWIFHFLLLQRQIPGLSASFRRPLALGGGIWWRLNGPYEHIGF